MALTAPRQATTVATCVYLASGAPQQFLPAAVSRVETVLQIAGGPIAVGMAASPTASSGFVLASGQIQSMPLHSGAFYGQSEAASGATVPIRIWDCIGQSSD